MTYHVLKLLIFEWNCFEPSGSLTNKLEKGKIMAKELTREEL